MKMPEDTTKSPYTLAIEGYNSRLDNCCLPIPRTNAFSGNRWLNKMKNLTIGPRTKARIAAGRANPLKGRIKELRLAEKVLRVAIERYPVEHTAHLLNVATIFCSETVDEDF